jgi:hypothetical protein
MWNVTRILGPLLVALVLSACSSFHFDSQEVGLLRDSEQDSLEVELIYRNVWCGDDEDEVRHLEEAMERVTAGGRYFLLPPTFWDSDLDQGERELTEKEERLSAYEGRCLEFLRGITVLEARVFENEQGERPCLLQRIRLARISEGIRLLNESFHDGVLDEEEKEGGFAASHPGFDAETCRLLIEEAKVGVDWVSWSDETLKVEFPTTPATAAHMLGEFMDLAGDTESWNVFAVVAGMARSLTEIEVRDDHVYMEFRPGEGGWLRIEFTGLEWRE